MARKPPIKSGDQNIDQWVKMVINGWESSKVTLMVWFILMVGMLVIGRGKHGETKCVAFLMKKVHIILKKKKWV